MWTRDAPGCPRRDQDAVLGSFGRALRARRLGAGLWFHKALPGTLRPGRRYARAEVRDASASPAYNHPHEPQRQGAAAEGRAAQARSAAASTPASVTVSTLVQKVSGSPTRIAAPSIGHGYLLLAVPCLLRSTARALRPMWGEAQDSERGRGSASGGVRSSLPRLLRAGAPRRAGQAHRGEKTMALLVLWRRDLAGRRLCARQLHDTPMALSEDRAAMLPVLRCVVSKVTVVRNQGRLDRTRSEFRSRRSAARHARATRT